MDVCIYVKVPLLEMHRENKSIQMWHSSGIGYFRMRYDITMYFKVYDFTSHQKVEKKRRRDTV